MYFNILVALFACTPVWTETEKVWGCQLVGDTVQVRSRDSFVLKQIINGMLKTHLQPLTLLRGVRRL